MCKYTHFKILAVSISFRFSYHTTHSFSYCKTFTQGKGRHILDKELHFSVHGNNSPTGKTIVFFSFLFLFHSCTYNTSWQKPLLTILLPTVPYNLLHCSSFYPQKRTDFPEISSKHNPITVGKNPYIKAEQDNPLEKVQRACKGVIYLIPYVRSGSNNLG